MKQTLPWLVILALILAGCAGTTKKDPAPTDDGNEPFDPASLVPEGTTRFVAIGDVGYGNAAQHAVGNAIAKICAERGCNFVIINGDNIYGSGVRSPYDPQFEEKFEAPYANVNLPFYLVLGNHDNGGGSGPNPFVGEYQVAYTYRTDRTSDKWNMPARWYTFRHGDVEFFGLDSGPEEVSQSPVWPAGSLGSQMDAWLATEFPKSTATWKFAFAHHPYISNSVHGDAGIYDNIAGRGLAYRQMIEKHLCGKIQVYFSGHDHNLQWLRPVQTCGATQFIVSGAGGASIYNKGREPHNDAFFENYSTHGFFWADVTGRTFTGAFYDTSGEKLFERSFTI